MNLQSTVVVPKVNPLRDVDFDVNDPNGWYRYAFLRTVYSCGLRLSEALHIRPGDIQRIFRQYGDAYIRDNRASLTEQHLKAIRAIRNCGTPEAGWIEFGCADCARPRHVERSCGSRMCPSCQSGKTAAWLDRRLEQQLPTHYFPITFTVPEELNPFFVHRPKEGFDALFKAASEALKALAANPRFVGADLPGFFGVLHTWGRTLNFHPHVHFVRRYLMHVLPTGFMRIRHYGFMGSGCAIPQDELVALVRMAQGFEVEAVEYVPAERQPFSCPKCGGRLVAKRILTTDGRLVATLNGSRPQRE